MCADFCERTCHTLQEIKQMLVRSRTRTERERERERDPVCVGGRKMLSQQMVDPIVPLHLDKKRKLR